MRALHAAIDSGVNFIDTADVYGDGRSERLVARLKRERQGEQIWVATKAGRQLPAQTSKATRARTSPAWVDRSLENLETDAIDLLQLHCPPPSVYDRTMCSASWTTSSPPASCATTASAWRRVDEALDAMRHPNVQTVQIIFNMFRLKPADAVLPAAQAKQVGILARVPLASGLLTGKLRRDSSFAPDDHRQLQPRGQLFDKGETFSGVPYRRARGGRACGRLCPRA